MKAWNYIYLSVFLAIFLTLAGFPIGTDVLNLIGFSTSNVNSNSLLYLAIFGGAGILIGLGTAIVIGTLTKSPTENYVILPLIVGSIILFGSTFYSIMNHSISNYPNWITYIVLIVFVPLSVGWLIALVEFFRGTD